MASKFTSIFIVVLLCPCMNVFSMSRDTKFFNEVLEAAWQPNASVTYQRVLGECYRIGQGVAITPQKAFEWHLKAAEGGVVYSQVTIGEFYETGFGVVKNPQLAFVWAMKAAQNGDQVAQGKVGKFYTCGFGVEPDLEKALEWYLKAATQIDSPIIKSSEYDLGKFYEEQIGDPWKAFVWYLKSARHGSCVATYEVIRCYENGFGVEKNHEKAEAWLHKNGYGQPVEINQELSDCVDAQIEYARSIGLLPK